MLINWPYNQQCVHNQSLCLYLISKSIESLNYGKNKKKYYRSRHSALCIFTIDHASVWSVRTTVQVPMHTRTCIRMYELI